MEQTWIWNVDGTDLYLDTGDTIRFRVESEVFNDHSPMQPAKQKTVEPPYMVMVANPCLN